MKLIKSFLLIFIALLTACSAVKKNQFLFDQEQGLLRDRGNDYLHAQEVAPMQVPEGLDQSAINQDMVIPPGQTPAPTAEFEVPKPKALQAPRSDAFVKLDREGENRWLIVDQAPEQVWPQVRAFWIHNNVPLDAENPSQGELETAWLELHKDNYKAIQKITDRMIGFGAELSYDRFKVWLQPGVKEGTTEVHLLHLRIPYSDALPAKDQIKWSEESSNKKLTVGLLNEMITYLATNAYQAPTVSLLAQNVEEKPRVVLTNDANQFPVLNIDLDFDRAWSAIGDALQAAEIKIEDLDRSTGTYYVSYGKANKVEKKEKSFWGRVFRFDNSAEEEQAAASDIALTKAYQLKLENSDNGVIVTVLVGEETLASVEESNKLLSLIKENLI